MNLALAEQVLISGLLAGSVYALIAVGLTIIFGVMRVINFAHGNIIVLAMYLTIFLQQHLGLDPYVSAFIMLPVFAVVGAFFYRIIINPLVSKGSSHTNQVLATLGVSIVLANLLLLVVGAQSKVIQTPYSTLAIHVGGIVISVPRLVAFGVAALVMVAFVLLLRYTYTGMAIRATAQDRSGAELVGISTTTTDTIAFALGTACAGIAGAIMMPFLFVNPTIDLDLGLTAYVIVVLGGLGSISGALVGGLLIGVVEAFSGILLDPELKQVVYLLLFVGILIVRPQGLFGVKGYEALNK